MALDLEALLSMFDADEIKKAMEGIAAKNKQDSDDYEKGSKAEQDLKNDVANKVADVSMLANTGVSIARFLEARKQIKKAKKEAEELKKNKPKLGGLTKNAQLQEALQKTGAESQYGFGAQSLGAKGALDLTAYANAIKAAQTMGGGQTGVTAGMQTQAYRDILGSNLQTAIANEKEKNEKVALHSALVGQGVSEDSDLRNIKFKNHLNNLRRYDAKLVDLKAAEQTGRINRDKILSQVPTQAANIVQNLYRRKEQRGQIPIKGTKEREAYDKAQEDLKLERSKAKEKMKLDRRSTFLDEQARRQDARRRLFRSLNPLSPYMSQPVMSQEEKREQEKANSYPPYYGLDMNDIDGTNDKFKHGRY
tara:strand:- start:14051 stop:15142 length:1092 start_codon:yes stop_codon:yes gene_type:complete